MRKNKHLFLIIAGFLVVTGVSLFFILRPQPKFNVILITVDALRADHLGCYGYKRNTSPNIDLLAHEGVRFTQAIAASSHTPPSIGSIATSTMPTRHWLLKWGDTLNPGIKTLGEILKSQGYRTVFLGGNTAFSNALHGFGRGFDTFYEHSDDAGTITGKALAFITEGTRPFFIWIHYMNTHVPYASAKPYADLFIDDAFYDKQRTVPIVKPFRDWYGYKGIAEPTARLAGGITNPDWYIAQYDGAIRTVDAQIGRIITTLEEQGLGRKTIIIFSSDHGEMLGEHQYYFHHGYWLYEPLIRIPLIITAHSIVPRSTIVDTQINAHLDMSPTILGLLRIPQAKSMQGKSLAGLIAAKQEYYSPYALFVDDSVTQYCIRTDEWKLLCDYYRDKKCELYNLRDDPDELHNQIQEYRKRYFSLKQRLDEAFDEEKKYYRAVPPVLDERTKERLQSLGYVQ